MKEKRVYAEVLADEEEDEGLPLSSSLAFNNFSLFTLKSYTAALMASSANMLQCNFTGGNDKCWAISLCLSHRYAKRNENSMSNGNRRKKYIHKTKTHP